MTAITNQTSFNALQAGDLNKLAEQSSDPCVSILMPTHRSGREAQQGPIRLKNLLKAAGAKLKDSGYDDSILDPIYSRTNQHNFWQHQGEGLAVFLRQGDCQMYRLNRPVAERVFVGSQFFVLPLIAEQNEQVSYFVLSLSWEDVALYRAEHDTLQVVQTAALPAKFDELVLPRDPEESLQNASHRSVGNTIGTSTAMFHGQGEGEDKIKADRNHYLSIVGEEVATAIYNSGMPLVVVATSEVIGHLKANSKVNVNATVEGSPTAWTLDELRDRAHEAIESQLKPDHSQFAERFGTAMAKSQASHQLEEVVSAARTGRIDGLMVCEHDDHCEKTNQAVIDTLRNGGDVYECKPDSMPIKNAVVAAVFRF